MIKFVILLFIIVSIMVLTPQIYQKFVIWDASNPSDDESVIHKFFARFTPETSIWNVKQSIEINTGVPIIDVRTKEEYDSGYIPGAILISEQTLYEQIPKLFPDKNRTLYLYSDNSLKGAVSTRLLRSMGYDRAFNVEEGLEGWKKANYQLDGYHPVLF